MAEGSDFSLASLTHLSGLPRRLSGKALPALQETPETQVRSLGWEDPLEWQLTLVFLPGELPWTEEPRGLQSIGLQRVRHD